MLELFLKLVDRFIRLAEIKESRREQHLALAKELFIQLQEIHTDYLRMFEVIDTQLKAPHFDAHGIYVRLKEERVALEPARRHVATLSNALLQRPDLAFMQDY